MTRQNCLSPWEKAAIGAGIFAVSALLVGSAIKWLFEEPDYIKEAKKNYARGEISNEEFDEMRKRLD